MPVTRGRCRPLSEYIKDMLALVIGTVLVMLVWLAVGGGTHTEMGSRSGGSQPVSAVGAVTVGLER